VKEITVTIGDYALTYTADLDERRKHLVSCIAVGTQQKLINYSVIVGYKTYPCDKTNA